MHPFDYVAAETLEEALGLLREHGDEAKVLAGGQSLVPMLNYRLARPGVVVDINRLPLGDISVDDGRLRLGALVRHHQLEESDVLARRCPVLGAAAWTTPAWPSAASPTVPSTRAPPRTPCGVASRPPSRSRGPPRPRGRRSSLRRTRSCRARIAAWSPACSAAAPSRGPSRGHWGARDRAPGAQRTGARDRGAPQPDAARDAARHARRLRRQGGL